MKRLDKVLAAGKAAEGWKPANPDAPTPEEDTTYAEALTAALGVPAGGRNTAAMWDGMSEEERAALLASPEYSE